MALKWLVGPLRTRIRVGVDRAMTQSEANMRKQTKPVKAAKPKKGDK